MKNIQRKRTGFQKSGEANKTITRINRLRVAFEQFDSNNQENFIEMISTEIETVEDETVKLWLIKFRAILQTVHEHSNQNTEAKTV